MSDDEAYDMGYTDGHQDGAREAWLIATPIIHNLRAALREIAVVPGSTLSECIAIARAALETPTASAAENKP